MRRKLNHSFILPSVLGDGENTGNHVLKLHVRTKSRQKKWWRGEITFELLNSDTKARSQCIQVVSDEGILLDLRKLAQHLCAVSQLFFNAVPRQYRGETRRSYLIEETVFMGLEFVLLPLPNRVGVDNRILLTVRSEGNAENKAAISIISSVSLIEAFAEEIFKTCDHMYHDDAFQWPNEVDRFTYPDASNLDKSDGIGSLTFDNGIISIELDDTGSMRTLGEVRPCRVAVRKVARGYRIFELD